jgi:hypothetical protein
VQVREGIDQIDRAICGVGVETILEHGWEPSRDDRGAREAMIPGDRHSLLIETGRNSIEEIGPVHIVLDIFLARPDDFDRAVDMLRNLDGANDAIDLEPPAKAAADGRPAVFAAAAWARAATWVPTQSSQPSLRT